MRNLSEIVPKKFEILPGIHRASSIRTNVQPQGLAASLGLMNIPLKMAYSLKGLLQKRGQRCMQPIAPIEIWQINVCS